MNKIIVGLLSTILLSPAMVGTSASSEVVLGYKDTPLLPGSKWHVHDPDRPMAPVVTPARMFSLGAPAPADAILLFAGKDFSHWVGTKGPIRWKIKDGYMQVVPGSGDIRTAQDFGDFQLHLEWAEPTHLNGDSQDRGNSGVFLHGRFEVQVLDTYNNRTYADGACGAIYGQYPPLVNACKPPGEWQSYDIFFEAPHWDANGQLTRPAYVTVIQNGLVVQDHQEILGDTGHRILGKYHPYSGTGPIELQEHKNPVRYRNIWIRALHVR